MVAWSVALVALAIGWTVGGRGVGGVLAFALASVGAFVGVGMMRLMFINRERVLSRNAWATSWVSGSSITDVRVEERGRGSLWSWGLDTSLPLTWVPLDVVIIEGGGRRIVADALRSDRRVHRQGHPAETVARVRVDVIERWRSTWWRDDERERRSEPTASYGLPSLPPSQRVSGSAIDPAGSGSGSCPACTFWDTDVPTGRGGRSRRASGADSGGRVGEQDEKGLVPVDVDGEAAAGDRTGQIQPCRLFDIAVRHL